MMEYRLRTDWTETALKAAIVLGSLCYISAFLFIAFEQIRYPYELEWMEGGMVSMMQRVLEGQPLYAAPSLEYVPYTYAPLYFHLSAWLSRITGGGFLPMRLLSFLSTVGCLLIVALFTFQHTRSALFSVFSAGILAGMFRLGGAWFVLARTDMPMFLLVFAAIWLLFGRQLAAWRLVLAALLFVLAFHIKQTALVISMPVALYTMIFAKGWRRGLFPALIAIVIPLVTRHADQISAGWYSFYMFELPSSHHLVLSRFISFWLMDLFRPLFIAFVLGLLFLLLLLREKKWREAWFLFFAMGGLGGAAWVVRMQSATYVNTVLPAYIGTAFFLGLAAHSLYAESSRWRLLRADQPAAQPKTARYTQIVLLSACLAQLLVLFYDPTVQIPTRADREAGDKLITLIAGFEGPVFIPAHGYYTVMAGKPAYAQQVACDDVNSGKNRNIAEAFSRHVDEVIRSGWFEAIILDHPWHVESMADVYAYRGDIFDNDEVFWPVTGRRLRPKSLFVRKAAIVPPAEKPSSPSFGNK